jgi:hypothetical protein
MRCAYCLELIQLTTICVVTRKKHLISSYIKLWLDLYVFSNRVHMETKIVSNNKVLFESFHTIGQHGICRCIKLLPKT